MSTATTWEEGAAEALRTITLGAEVMSALDLTEDMRLSTINFGLRGITSAANSDNWNEESTAKGIMALGLTARPSVNRSDAEIVTLLAEKQAAYGSENILAFGFTGLHVRVSDKVARINNMLERGRHAQWEPLDDSWLDLVGYGAIAHMLYRKTFTLPLQRDQ